MPVSVVKTASVGGVPVDGRGEQLGADPDVGVVDLAPQQPLRLARRSPGRRAAAAARCHFWYADARPRRGALGRSSASSSGSSACSPSLASPTSAVVDRRSAARCAGPRHVELDHRLALRVGSPGRGSRCRPGTARRSRRTPRRVAGLPIRPDWPTSNGLSSSKPLLGLERQHHRRRERARRAASTSSRACRAPWPTSRVTCSASLRTCAASRIASAAAAAGGAAAHEPRESPCPWAGRGRRRRPGRVSTATPRSCERGVDRLLEQRRDLVDAW